ncbi:sulfotransferase family protein [Roseiconus lacunae]|uniref:sulfotransferase family protein n=1 Tax=Roseiconus lacunae TaxID=2605694 RepID=UPI001E527AE6|nr:sulfotransferase [Roseiconus lacunae]MCD0458162.1 sulfotransferase [Roseiconus lacunae]
MTLTTREGILLLGLPRSGTTLLRRLINAHSQISCPGETNLFGAASRFLRSDGFSKSPPIGVASGLSYLGFSESEVTDRLRNFVLGFHRDHVQSMGKRLWADKSPLDAFYLKAIEQLLGDHVFFVFLHRHALDFACSLNEFCSKAGGYYSEIHAYIASHKEPMVAFAEIWVEITEEMIRMEHRWRECSVSLRYEDLVFTPETELRQIFTLVECDWEPGLIGRAMADSDDVGLGDWKTYSKSVIDPSSIGRWAKLPSRTISLLAERVNPTLKKLGYPQLSIAKGKSSKEILREYELGLLIQQMRSKHPESPNGDISPAAE